MAYWWSKGGPLMTLLLPLFWGLPRKLIISILSANIVPLVRALALAMHQIAELSTPMLTSPLAIDPPLTESVEGKAADILCSLADTMQQGTSALPYCTATLLPICTCLFVLFALIVPGDYGCQTATCRRPFYP